MTKHLKAQKAMRKKDCRGCIPDTCPQVNTPYPCGVYSGFNDPDDDESKQGYAYMKKWKI
jgi:hypothetical protein